MTEAAKKKKKVRASSKWKAFRNQMSVEYKHKDGLTQKPLRKGFALHHMLLDDNRYNELEPDRFIPLNKTSHDTIHFCYNYAKNDRGFLERLVALVNKMLELNKE